MTLQLFLSRAANLGAVIGMRRYVHGTDITIMYHGVCVLIATEPACYPYAKGSMRFVSGHRCDGRILLTHPLRTVQACADELGFCTETNGQSIGPKTD